MIIDKNVCQTVAVACPLEAGELVTVTFIVIRYLKRNRETHNETSSATDKRTTLPKFTRRQYYEQTY